MPALLENALDQDDPLKSSTGYEAGKIEMDDSDSMAKRVAKLSSEESPVVQLNQTKARQAQNRSGLLNTSMTTGEVVKAGIETAIPIAGKDVDTASTYKQSNVAAENRAKEFSAGQSNVLKSQLGSNKQSLAEISASGSEQRKNIAANTEAESRLLNERGELEKQIQSADQANKETLQNRQGEIDRELESLRSQNAVEAESRLAAEAAEYDYILQNLRGDQAEQLSLIETQSANLRQTSSNVALVFSQISASISEILREPEITTAAKQQLVNKELELLENSMALQGSMAGLDLSGLLVFDSPNLTGGTTTTGQDDFPGSNITIPTGNTSTGSGSSGSNADRQAAIDSNADVLAETGVTGTANTPQIALNQSFGLNVNGNNSITSADISNKAAELQSSSGSYREAVRAFHSWGQNNNLSLAQIADSLGVTQSQLTNALSR